MQRETKWMVCGIVGTIAALAVVTPLGCMTGQVKGEDTCRNEPEKSFAILAGLLSTVIGLGVRTDDQKEEPVRKVSIDHGYVKPRAKKVTPTEK